MDDPGEGVRPGNSITRSRPPHKNPKFTVPTQICRPPAKFPAAEVRLISRRGPQPRASRFEGRSQWVTHRTSAKGKRLQVATSSGDARITYSIVEGNTDSAFEVRFRMEIMEIKFTLYFDYRSMATVWCVLHRSWTSKSKRATSWRSSPQARFRARFRPIWALGVRLCSWFVVENHKTKIVAVLVPFQPLNSTY